MILGMTKKSTGAAAVKTVPAKARKAAIAAPAEGDKIGKTQMAVLMSEKASLSTKHAAQVIDAVLGIVIDALKAGKSASLPGVGTLSVRATAARQGVKPGTAERIEIAAGKKVSYKVASTLKSAL